MLRVLTGAISNGEEGVEGSAGVTAMVFGGDEM